MRLSSRWSFTCVACLTLLCLALVASPALAANEWGLKSGGVELKSAGPLAFGPDGILIVGDPSAATVWAIATGDVGGNAGSANYNIQGFEKKLAEELGAKPEQTKIADMVVNPASGNLFLSVSVGEPAQPVIAKVNIEGKIDTLSLTKVESAKIQLPKAPESNPQGRRGDPRNDSITDVSYVNGKVIVSGLAATDGSNVASTVREINLPFDEADTGANVEIYHAAHGKYEDNAVVRTFAPMVIDGEPTLLAGFTCTPLVKFPLGDLDAGKKVRGTTVAELGNRNKPLDMIVYQKGGKDFLLMSNSARGVMKISTDKIRENSGLTEPVKGGGTAGQPFETIKELEGVEQLDKLDDTRAVILAKSGDSLNLKTIELP